MKKIKIKRTNQTAIIFIAIAMLGMIWAYFAFYTKSYPSLEYAIQRTTNGGKVTASYEFDKGVFVYLKNTSKKYEYYYVLDKRWYNKGLIRETKFKIENKYTVTIYNVPENKIAFIRIDSKKELSNLTDSLNTEFTELSTDKKNKFFFGGTYKEIPEEYTIYINDKEYLLKDYNSFFNLSQ